MADPEVAVQGAIAAAAIPGLTQATVSVAPFDGNLIVGPLVKTADGAPVDPCVFVQSTGGPFCLRFLGMTLEHKGETVQIVTRSAPKDFSGGMALARAVFNAIDYAALTGYYLCECREAGPVHLGVDEENRHLFSFNINLRRAA